MSASIYSYDMMGNFIGLNSPVIDLTLDTSGYIANDNSFSSSGKRRQRPKKEVVSSESVVGGSEGVREKGRGGEVSKPQKKGEDTNSAKRHQKRRKRLIPLSLSRLKKRAGVATASEEEEEEERGEREEESVSVTRSHSVERGRDSDGGKSRQRHREKSNKAAISSHKGGKRGRKSTRDESITHQSQLAAETSAVDEGTETERREREAEREEREVESGGVAAEDCLVSPLPPAPQALSRVKVRHKQAKKRVSISNEVIVMGGGGESGEGVSVGRGEWSLADQRNLCR